MLVRRTLAARLLSMALRSAVRNTGMPAGGPSAVEKESFHFQYKSEEIFVN